VCCSVLHCVVVEWGKRVARLIAVDFTVQCVAVCCDVLQCVVMCCSVL